MTNKMVSLAERTKNGRPVADRQQDIETEEENCLEDKILCMSCEGDEASLGVSSVSQLKLVYNYRHQHLHFGHDRLLFWNQFA